MLFINQLENTCFLSDEVRKKGHDACPTGVRCFLIRGTLLAPDGQNLCQTSDQ